STRRWQNGSAVQARIEVYGEGVLTSESAVSKWLQTTGADAIVGTRSEKLLTAAFQDTNWREYARMIWGRELNPVKQMAIASSATPASICTLRSFRAFGVVQPEAARAQLCGNSWLEELLRSATAKGDRHLKPY